MNSSKNVLKARCDGTGLFVKLVFWGYAVYLAVMLGIGLWMLGQAGSTFQINLLNTGNGLAGYGFFKGSLEVDFARNVLNERAASSPKLVYLIGYLGGCVEKALILAVLWNIVHIFPRLNKEESPFQTKNCRSVFRIGVLVTVIGFVRTGLIPTILGILRYADVWSGNYAFWWYCLIIGAIIICFSYIFEYGMALQTESDETL
ncbi:MAG: DUF2975 domain-containing protein [Lachnospiraceae bacterium]|nr:DUF2975 domain-containing protein [Lachnospiraceae bacterium]